VKVSPKVFISYSHEGPDHRIWVIGLSSALLENGIDVILDVWGVRLGQDLAKFMESSVNDADRVLVICTDTYNSKADRGVGGVGYEKGILSAEILADANTTKFVPVIRSVTTVRKTPLCMGARNYIDFSDDGQFATQLERLLRELHDARPAKPPIGQNPFARNNDKATPFEPNAPAKPGKSKRSKAEPEYPSHIMKAKSDAEWNRIERLNEEEAVRAVLEDERDRSTVRGKIKRFIFPESYPRLFVPRAPPDRRESLKTYASRSNQDEFLTCPGCGWKLKAKNVLLHFDRRTCFRSLAHKSRW
jgi:hypothetical protein